MRLEIVPFTEQHFDAAAELLAARQRAERAREPALPVKYEDAAETRPLVQAALGTESASGVVALRGGRLAGYLIGVPVMPDPVTLAALFIRPRSARMTFAGHAIDPDDGIETYREMYAAIAPRWIEAGCFSHYVDVPAGDEQPQDAWFSLGFGHDTASAVRDTGPVEGADVAGLDVHQAGTEDIDVIMPLLHGLMRYFAEPPMFSPYLPETEADQRRFQQEMLSNPASAHWLAYREGKAIGIQTFRSSFLSEMLTPGRSV